MLQVFLIGIGIVNKETFKLLGNMGSLIKLEGLNNFNTLCKSYIDLNNFLV